jgi:hypothetical protein
VVDDEKTLLREIMTAGLDEASLPELQQQLREYLSGPASPGVPSDYGMRGAGARGIGGAGAGGGVDMSSLDALLRDDDDVDDVVEASRGEDAVRRVGAGGDAVAAGSAADSVIDDSLESTSTSTSTSSFGVYVPKEIDIDSGAEWERVLKEYVKQPTSVLERERDRVFGKLEYSLWTEARTEQDLYTYKRQR